MAGPLAVFFDVDFTLIHPGPRFQGSGYQRSCARHGLTLDPARFERAVAGAAAVLESADADYDADLYLAYTRRIIELMGGEDGADDLTARRAAIDAAARETYDEWAHHHHFSLYDDVVETLTALRQAGIRLGLISNSHRCLASFQSHFELDGLVSVAVSSAEHGYMKPHPAIFQAALQLMQVAPGEAVMVGDSLMQDVEGAERIGMRGVLLARAGRPATVAPSVSVIRSLRELRELMGQAGRALSTLNFEL
ncbi:MAG TPA: HAD family hydrolase [Vicinamibacterales bacterium]|nr:HAD family hydrolase [Vicinamibacterales bacterium]